MASCPKSLPFHQLQRRSILKTNLCDLAQQLAPYHCNEPLIYVEFDKVHHLHTNELHPLAIRQHRYGNHQLDSPYSEACKSNLRKNFLAKIFRNEEHLRQNFLQHLLNQLFSN